jgi:hypothetical protein
MNKMEACFCVSITSMIIDAWNVALFDLDANGLINALN